MVRRALTAALLSAVALGAAAEARPVQVPADHATLIRLPDTASAVVVGNPSIADATLYDGQTLFVTGKLFGRTNLIALDTDGRVVYTNDLVVSRSDRGSVEVFRNVNRESYSCAPTCEAAPRVGDQTDWFTDRASQQADRIGAAQAGLPASQGSPRPQNN
ncbi:hypothetical protein GCM10011367_14330 [Marinicauda pacifica]|jgi:hypothetical protein|uniref:Pilus assembly protein n=1 Tax=Marinicauda pacifica TaxID=1133559 RepID=A0A4S2HAB1_9PROT|nr:MULTISPECIES: pilus assembly protein N-terminal domain-containing protein [Marinicauda]TGY92857.1 pilus assembly protein [Marinicauda pacifica]GGE40913.1 hypothetical protein GCM10011367_14330 [Marinicauda pacifica]